MTRSSKKKPSNNYPFWTLLLILFTAVLSSIYILLYGTQGNPENSKQFSPEEWSKKLIEVKKDPLPSGWQRPLFPSFQSGTQKQKAAVDIVYNEMLSQIEPALGIPSQVASKIVTADSEKYLTQLYGDPQNVPQAVYRVACQRIYNSQVDFKRFYKGNPRKMRTIVLQIMSDYYERGKPPGTLSMQIVEDYIRKHKREIPKP